MTVGKFRRLIEFGKKAAQKVKTILPKILQMYRTVTPALQQAIPQVAPIVERVNEFADVADTALRTGDLNETARKARRITQRIEEGRLLPTRKEFSRAAGKRPFIKLQNKV